MEYLLQHIEVVAELYNIVETLGDEVDFFNEDPIFLFVGQCELDNIDYFFHPVGTGQYQTEGNVTAI